MARQQTVASSTRRNPRGRPRQRAEQERALNTRALILNAALAEFAERGFERASIRGIAERLGLQHPLITYHYRTKDLLWRATAEHAFEQIRVQWDQLVPQDATLSPFERLREEYRALFKYTVAFPEFHRFMRQEAFSRNPRLRWVAEALLRPLLARLLPQITAAQEEGRIPNVEPIVFHYMMVSLTATLSEFGPEMQVASGVSAANADVVEQYWSLVESTVFRASAGEGKAVRSESTRSRSHRRARNR
jgi:TetR/AcrR family transcriptional regulator